LENANDLLKQFESLDDKERSSEGIKKAKALIAQQKEEQEKLKQQMNEIKQEAAEFKTINAENEIARAKASLLQAEERK